MLLRDPDLIPETGESGLRRTYLALRHHTWPLHTYAFAGYRIRLQRQNFSVRHVLASIGAHWR